MHIRSFATCALGASVLAGSAPALAGQATFQLLTTQDAPAVTIDEFGRTLVLTKDGGTVFIYEDGVYNFVGSGNAQGLSGDGNWVAGTIPDGEGVQEAARGVATGGWTPLGGVDQCDFLKSSGFGVSGDGSKVVGLAYEGCTGRAFLWAEMMGIQLLEELANGGNRADAISSDGEVITGFAQGTFARTPAAWLSSTGLAHPTYPFDPDVQGEINAVSSDGSILAGRYYDENTPGFYILPFYWTESQGVVLLPSVSGFPGGNVLDVSDDGRTLVGNSGVLIEGVTATVWRPEWGAADLKTKLIELGADVPDGYTPFFARGVSDDGQTVVGWGSLAGIGNRAFVATLPPAETLPCPPDLTGDGAVGFGDLTQLLSAWGPCAGCDEDLDENDQVGFSDLTLMLNAWGPCP